MTELLERVTSELDIINNDDGEYQFEMKEAYLKNFSMTDALTVKQKFEENARRKAEYEAKRQAEIEERKERERAEAERVASAGKEQTNENAEIAAAKTVNAVEKVTEQLITLDFRVKATAAQLEGLKNYLKSNNIEFGPVK